MTILHDSWSISPVYPRVFSVSSRHLESGVDPGNEVGHPCTSDIASLNMYFVKNHNTNWIIATFFRTFQQNNRKETDCYPIYPACHEHVTTKKKYWVPEGNRTHDLSYAGRVFSLYSPMPTTWRITLYYLYITWQSSAFFIFLRLVYFWAGLFNGRLS